MKSKLEEGTWPAGAGRMWSQAWDWEARKKQTFALKPQKRQELEEYGTQKVWMWSVSAKSKAIIPDNWTQKHQAQLRTERLIHRLLWIVETSAFLYLIQKCQQKIKIKINLKKNASRGLYQHPLSTSVPLPTPPCTGLEDSLGKPTSPRENGYCNWIWGFLPMKWMGHCLEKTKQIICSEACQDYRQAPKTHRVK